VMAAIAMAAMRHRVLFVFMVVSLRGAGSG
jgi:hypothetical protein